MNIKNLPLISACIASMFAMTANAQVTIVDDNLIGIGNDQTAANAALDANYFATSSSDSAIEFSDAGVGLVTGFSGRQIHALFPRQTLNAVGDSLTMSVTFVTPTSINLDGEVEPDPTPSGSNDIRVGLFDDNELSGLAANITASSTNPNPLLNDLSGSFVEMDVELDGSQSSADLQIRTHDIANSTGRLMGVTSGFIAVNENAATTGSGSNSGPSIGYLFVPNNSYTVNYTVERVEALDVGGNVIADAPNTIDITAEFRDATADVSIGTLVRTDIAPTSFSFAMIAIGASTEAFGINNQPGEPDNGIELTAVSVETNIAGGGTGPVDPPVADEACYTLPTNNGGTAVFCL